MSVTDLLLLVYALGALGGFIARFIVDEAGREATLEVFANIALILAWPVLLPAWVMVRWLPHFTRWEESYRFRVEGPSRDLEGEARWVLGRKDRMVFFGRGRVAQKREEEATRA